MVELEDLLYLEKRFSANGIDVLNDYEKIKGYCLKRNKSLDDSNILQLMLILYKNNKSVDSYINNI